MAEVCKVFYINFSFHADCGSGSASWKVPMKMQPGAGLQSLSYNYVFPDCGNRSTCPMNILPAATRLSVADVCMVLCISQAIFPIIACMTPK